MKKFVVLISGNGSNLQAIIDAKNRGEITGELVCVISNRADAYGLTRAQEANIPTHVIDHTAYETREQFDAALQTYIDQHAIDLIVLAGFMRKLSENFVRHYQGRLINIHPSLLPKFRGLNTHQRVLDAGETEHGLSIHYVSVEVDAGAIIAQAKTLVDANDDAKTLQQRVHQLEHQCYPIVIQKVLNGEISLSEKGTLHHGSLLPECGMLLNI